MKTDKERAAILDHAEKEIQEVCEKYNVTIESYGDIVFLSHHDRYDNGDWSVSGRELKCHTTK